MRMNDCERQWRSACFVSLSFAGLVVLARSLNPIPSRTRPLNSSAPMVLWLKPWESRSLPGLPRTKQFLFTCHDQQNAASLRGGGVFVSARPQVFSFNLMFVRSHASGSVCLARPSGLNTCTVPCAFSRSSPQQHDDAHQRDWNRHAGNKTDGKNRVADLLPPRFADTFARA